MPELPRSAQSAIAAYAQSMGIAPHTAPDGAQSFAFERAGRLSFVASEEGDVLMSLTRPVIVEGAANLARLAALGRILPQDDMPLHAGLTKAGQPVLIARIPAPALDSSRLEQTVALLSRECEAAGL